MVNLLAKLKIEIGRKKIFTQEDGIQPEGKKCKIIYNPQAGSKIQPTNGCVAVIKYAKDKHKLINANQIGKVKKGSEMVVFIKDGDSFHFARSSENGLFIENKGGTAKVSFHKKAIK